MTALVRRDANHAEVKQALMAAGRPVLDVSRHHGLGFDLLVEHRDGRLIAMEIKATKRATLTESESHAAALFRDYVVVTSVPEALAAVGLIRSEAA